MEGKYQVNVQHALEFLIRSQAPDGNLFGDAKVFARMYCHSMALLALSEALAVTGDERLKDAVERGVIYSARSQNRTDGGWRYQPGDRGDMSQFGWQVMAMHSASIDLDKSWFDQIKEKHPGDVVLIVGHSNTADKIVEGLGGKGNFSLDDDEYDSLFVVSTKGREARAMRIRYGSQSGKK